MNPIIRIPGVYYVTDEEGIVGPLAIRPTWNQQTNTVSWEDTGRGSVVKLGISSFQFADFTTGQALPSVIDLTSSEGEKYHLQKLTKEVYDKSVKEQTISSQDFPTTEAIQNYYLNQTFGY